jgi:hypothetical protein
MVNAAAALGAAAAAAAAAHPQAGHQLRCIRQVERLPGQHIGEQGHKVRGSVNGVEGTGDGGCELQGCGAHSRGRVLWLAGQWWVLRGGGLEEVVCGCNAFCCKECVHSNASLCATRASGAGTTTSNIISASKALDIVCKQIKH